MKNLYMPKVLVFFIENPYEEVYLREISKKIKISPYTAKKYLDRLVKDKLIVEERKGNLRYFKANLNNLVFRHLKTAYKLYEIEESGLVEFLQRKIPNVSSIVLFGSGSRGEDSKESDIDILVIGKEIPLNLSEFEKKLKKEINLHIFTWSEWNKQAKDNKAFYIEVLKDGITLYGELPVIPW